MRPLADAVRELRDAAARLRDGSVGPDEAADLVDRCAELAAEIGVELDRQAREARSEPPPGQETLLP